jgi:hypothetical protein
VAKKRQQKSKVNTVPFVLIAVFIAVVGMATWYLFFSEEENTSKTESATGVVVITGVPQNLKKDESKTDDESGEKSNDDTDGIIRQNGTVDVTKVPHLFIYPLINDSRAFDVNFASKERVVVNNSNNFTTQEFKVLLEKLYEADFMLVRLRDLVEETESPGGGVLITPREDLKLPEGKKPIILTEDNVNYHHTTQNMGYASKLIVRSGKIKCVYVNANGTEKVGNYDAVPILEEFIERYPDFSYEGARMTLALTGYNGVFGYRTDAAYQTGEGLTQLQKDWLSENPDFSYDKDVEDAREVANALLAAGYEFANKTWGDRIVGTSTLTDLKVDMEKWKTSVEPIIGKVDTYVFAHDSDISDKPGEYLTTNEKFNYFTDEGYHFFCTESAQTFGMEAFGTSYTWSMRYGLTPFNVREWNRSEPATSIMNALGLTQMEGYYDSDRTGDYAYLS